MSALKDSEAINILLQSTGCFHDSQTEFLMTGGEHTTLHVTKPHYEFDRRLGKKVSLGKEVMGTVSLTQEERQGLDSTFEFYRGSPQGGCTSTDRVSVEYLRDGTVVGTESFVDDSCLLLRKIDGFWLPEDVEHLEKTNPNVLKAIPLWEFSTRLETAKYLPPGPKDTILDGRWVVEGEHISPDREDFRIRGLIRTRFRFVGTGKVGDPQLLEDPSDGRVWMLTNPNPELPGGGPLRMQVVSPGGIRYLPVGL